MYEMCRVRGAGLKTVHLPPYKPFPCFVGLCCYRCDYECTHRCWNILHWVYLKMLKSLGAAFPLKAGGCLRCRFLGLLLGRCWESPLSHHTRHPAVAELPAWPVVSLSPSCDSGLAPGT